MFHLNSKISATARQRQTIEKRLWAQHLGQEAWYTWREMRRKACRGGGKPAESVGSGSSHLPASLWRDVSQPRRPPGPWAVHSLPAPLQRSFANCWTVSHGCHLADGLIVDSNDSTVSWCLHFNVSTVFLSHPASLGRAFPLGH